MVNCSFVQAFISKFLKLESSWKHRTFGISLPLMPEYISRDDLGMIFS